MLYIILTIFVGMLPEVLYFTKIIEYSKNLKEHKIKFLALMTLVYVLCILVSQYKTLYYLAFIFLSYFVLKILYKKNAKITDIFLVLIAYIYLTFNAVVCHMFLKEDLSNYYLITIINRFTLFIPFIFKNKFNILYKKYMKLWNRNDTEKRPIKSITLRNISLICLNIFIFIANLILINIM